MANLIKEQEFIELIRLFELRSASVRSLPPIITEAEPADIGKLREQVADLYAPDGSDKLQGRHNFDISFNTSELVAANIQDEQYREYRNEMVTEHHKIEVSQGRRILTTIPQHIPLPIGRRHVDHRVPESNTTILDAQRMLQDQICSVYGVPRSVVSSEHGHHTIASATNVTQTLNHTVSMWQKLLSHILTNVYQDMYGKADCEETTKIIQRERGGTVIPLFNSTNF